MNCNSLNQNLFWTFSLPLNASVSSFRPFHDRSLGLKTGIDFAYFGLESAMVFEGLSGVYEFIHYFSSK